jgi:hypothetical protein
MTLGFYRRVFGAKYMREDLMSYITCVPRTTREVRDGTLSSSDAQRVGAMQSEKSE